MFIPGMITLIFRGPLNPKTLVSWNGETKSVRVTPSFYLFILPHLAARLFYITHLTNSLKTQEIFSQVAHEDSSNSDHNLRKELRSIKLIKTLLNLQLPTMSKILNSSWILLLLSLFILLFKDAGYGAAYIHSKWLLALGAGCWLLSWWCSSPGSDRCHTRWTWCPWD